MTNTEAKKILSFLTLEVSKCEAPSDYTYLEKSAYVKALEDTCGAYGRGLAAYVKENNKENTTNE